MAPTVAGRDIVPEGPEPAEFLERVLGFSFDDGSVGLETRKIVASPRGRPLHEKEAAIPSKRVLVR